MSYNYELKAAKASRMIRKFGTTATLRKVAISGDKWSPTLDNSDISVSLVDVSKEQRNGSGQLTGITEHKFIVAAADGVSIDVKDKLTFGSRTFELKAVAELAPAGTTVLWEAWAIG